MDAVVADTYTHFFSHSNTEHTKLTDTNVPVQASALTNTHFFSFFLPQRQCMAGVLFLLMMKSSSDSAALRRVDALLHSVAMLCKFSVSPHWKHGGFSSRKVFKHTLTFLYTSDALFLEFHRGTQAVRTSLPDWHWEGSLVFNAHLTGLNHRK